MNRKVLFIATVESHILNFHLPYLQYFQQQGFETHVACNGSKVIPFCDYKHDISFTRFPFTLQNVFAYRQLKSLGEFDIIHCHTPVGGVLGRLYGAHVKRAKVLYTAHGFHFCENGPLINWIIFYPIERLLAKKTDCLITMNSEDYKLAKKFKPDVEFINGIGVDVNRFAVETLPHENFNVLYVAELSKRKNQSFIINAMRYVNIPNVSVLFVGSGKHQEQYEKLVAKLSLQNKIQFLGQRSDISNLLSITDVYVSSSKREGLPVNILEAMCARKCIIASDVRGNNELIKHNKTGLLFNVHDQKQFANLLHKVYNDNELRKTLGQNAFDYVQNFSLEVVLSQMSNIYQKIISR